MSATDHTIQLQDLALGYPGRTLFEHVDLSFNRGELTALIGRNGTGKSTLLRTVMGLLKPLHGQILIGEIRCIRCHNGKLPYESASCRPKMYEPAI